MAGAREIKDIDDVIARRLDLPCSRQQANPIQKSVHDGLAVAKVCRQARRLGWAPVPPLYLEPGVCDRQALVALLYGQGD